MRANTPGFIGARLAQVRKAMGLTGVALAERLDVSQQTVTQYEKGRQSPRPEVMQRLIELTAFPQSFFLSQPRERGERNVMYRSLSAATKSARERAETRFDWFREIVEFMSAHFDFPEIRLPKFESPADFRSLTHEQIEGVAIECRELWGFGDKPVPNVVMALESNGIIVARGSFGSEHLDAFSEFLPGDWPYIFLGDDKRVAARSRFDAAHELGHLILHRNTNPRSFNAPKDFKQLEAQAHRFAAAFLLPSKSFSQSIWAPTLDAFRAQKPYWRVSIKGMIVRSHQIGMIDDSQYERMLINYARRYKDGEPDDEAVSIEQPKLIARCFEMLLDGAVMTRDQIRASLSLPASEVESLASLPRGYLSAPRAEVVAIPVFKQSKNEGVDQSPSSNVVSLTRFRGRA